MDTITQNKRLLALDVFRGMTIAFMILVNTPGSWTHIYDPLRHAKWHGATPTDMVFPFFLFIVGVSMFFSFSKFNQALDARLTKKILVRVALIFLIGLALNYYPFVGRTIEKLRIMGVLQRIALAYGIAAFLCVAISPRQLWKAGLAILAGYWLILGVMGGDDPFSLEENFARRVDLAVFSENHVYKGFGIPFDPEGLLSTVPAAVTVIFGYLAGSMIQHAENRNMLVKNLLLIGVATLFAGLVWDQFFPINKPLWTSSYVLYAGGIASVIIALLIEVIDNRGYVSWTNPFVVFGMNPLIIFVFAGLLAKTMSTVIRWTEGEQTRNLYGLIANLFASALPGYPKLASILFAVLIVSVCWLFGYVLYRRKIFIKV